MLKREKVKPGQYIIRHEGNAVALVQKIADDPYLNGCWETLWLLEGGHKAFGWEIAPTMASCLKTIDLRYVAPKREAARRLKLEVKPEQVLHPEQSPMRFFARPHVNETL